MHCVFPSTCCLFGWNLESGWLLAPLARCICWRPSRFGFKNQKTFLKNKLKSKLILVLLYSLSGLFVATFCYSQFFPPPYNDDGNISISLFASSISNVVHIQLFDFKNTMSLSCLILWLLIWSKVVVLKKCALSHSLIHILDTCLQSNQSNLFSKFFYCCEFDFGYFQDGVHMHILWQWKNQEAMQMWIENRPLYKTWMLGQSQIECQGEMVMQSPLSVISAQPWKPWKWEGHKWSHDDLITIFYTSSLPS